MPRKSSQRAMPIWYRWRAVFSTTRIGVGMPPRRSAPVSSGRHNTSAPGRNYGPRLRPNPESVVALDDQIGRRIDQVHVIHVGVKLHWRAGIGGAVRLDPPADFRAIHREEDHRLHAERLDDIQRHREVAAFVTAIMARLGDVLGAQ